MTDDAERMWHEFHERLRGFIARRVNNPADVEDILQEVFLRIHQHIAAVREPNRVVAWIFQITRHAIIDYYRVPFRRSETPDAHTVELASRKWGTEDGASFPNEDRATAHREMAASLGPMIDRLPQHYREAVILVDIEGVPQRVAAEQLGLSVSGMKSRVQRGRHKLKYMLQACCHLQFDYVGNVIEYEIRDGVCHACGAHTKGVGQSG